MCLANVPVPLPILLPHTSPHLLVLLPATSPHLPILLPSVPFHLFTCLSICPVLQNLFPVKERVAPNVGMNKVQPNCCSDSML